MKGQKFEPQEGVENKLRGTREKGGEGRVDFQREKREKGG